MYNCYSSKYKGKNMKITILILLSTFFTTVTFGDIVPPKKDKAMCKLFTEKAIKYEKTMRDDEYAIVTLHSYKKRAKLYCPDK